MCGLSREALAQGGKSQSERIIQEANPPILWTQALHGKRYAVGSLPAEALYFGEFGSLAMRPFVSLSADLPTSSIRVNCKSDEPTVLLKLWRRFAAYAI